MADKTAINIIQSIELKTVVCLFGKNSGYSLQIKFSAVKKYTGNS